ncbi:DNA binding methylated-DNA--cysteine S-methyltransferase [Neolentinus lepideus HHB14362 ss-1]|uniref:Methylated-DNA--protein-cysteine methyltransferase n=1 Tax=Neolentinus lepideus HHB14362 ss-1 TaxID=1314782 RepID=A0A165R294_9AGAM|nr:DNA binding methylated-DNA--cysteine S-methyltransferase [Neolentinus lepideus HHB14362 ss-1]
MPVIRRSERSIHSPSREKRRIPANEPGATDDIVLAYPCNKAERNAFRTTSGRKVTDHQWAVYDYILQVPKGKVTTYKQVCLAISEGTPRSVGTALRNNPFAPYVPCHRVIASNFFIGGFRGEWGTIRKAGIIYSKTPSPTGGLQCQRKLEILKKEGVNFDSEGYLRDKDHRRVQLEATL